MRYGEIKFACNREFVIHRERCLVNDHHQQPSTFLPPAVGETPRSLAELFVPSIAPAMSFGPYPVVIRGRTPTSTMARINNIIRHVLEPQQVDPQSVIVQQFSEVAASVQGLCQKYDLCPLVDLQELTNAVEASGGDPSSLNAASSSGGDPSGEVVGKGVDPPCKVTIMGDSTW